jgi:hypothetical protein
MKTRLYATAALCVLLAQLVAAAVDSLVVRYPLPEHAPTGTSARAVYQAYGPARIEASNSFDRWSRSQHYEDKTLFSRYFFGKVNGTVIESGAMVIPRLSFVIHLFYGKDSGIIVFFLHETN